MFTDVIVANTPTVSVIAPTYVILEWEAAATDNASITYRAYSTLEDGSGSVSSLLATTGATSIVYDGLTAATLYVQPHSHIAK